MESRTRSGLAAIVAAAMLVAGPTGAAAATGADQGGSPAGAADVDRVPGEAWGFTSTDPADQRWTVQDRLSATDEPYEPWFPGQLDVALAETGEVSRFPAPGGPWWPPAWGTLPGREPLGGQGESLVTVGTVQQVVAGPVDEVPDCVPGLRTAGTSTTFRRGIHVERRGQLVFVVDVPGGERHTGQRVIGIAGLPGTVVFAEVYKLRPDGTREVRVARLDCRIPTPPGEPPVSGSSSGTAPVEGCGTGINRRVTIRPPRQGGHAFDPGASDIYASVCEANATATELRQAANDQNFCLAGAVTAGTILTFFLGRAFARSAIGAAVFFLTAAECTAAQGYFGHRANDLTMAVQRCGTQGIVYRLEGTGLSVRVTDFRCQGPRGEDTVGAGGPLLVVSRPASSAALPWLHPGG